VTESNVNKGEGSEVSSSTLLARVRAQDPAAWGRLVSLCSPLVYHWCRQSGLQAADAADVGQEVFKAVFRSVQQFRKDRTADTFRGWLRTITQNKIRDHFRKKHAEVSAAGGSEALKHLAQVPALELEDSADPAGEDAALYRRALDLIRNDFENRTWQAFLNVAVERRPPADVARELNMTVNAVYLAKSHVLRRVREEFADLLDIA
jgi:RNA polymerase sigma-70 factor (ECF subfamily)